jgi:hypothetical protein
MTFHGTLFRANKTVFKNPNLNMQFTFDGVSFIDNETVVDSTLEPQDKKKKPKQP